MQEDYTNYQNLMNSVKTLSLDAMTQLAYDTWISPIEIASIEGDTITFLVPSVIYKNQILPYEPILTNCFKDITHKLYKFNYITQDDLNNNIPNAPQMFNENYKTNLRTDLTFNNFVIGENNKFAHAAAMAVSESPGTFYNPLFIYSNVGLGKTHLMHAIGNAVLERYPNKKVLYVTSEQFTNDFINAIRDNSNESFRQKYRNIDVLLIDDIQFIAKKEGIQEEFFHTFNSICENKGQIVLSSDKPPKDINPLEERLRSRFDGGILVDIPSANYETRLAILRKIVQQNNIIVDDLILSNIATKVDTNIRELIGTLKKIVVQASLTHSPITFDSADKAIADVVARKERIISPDYIKQIVAKYFHIEVEDINSTKRSNNIAYPRQVAMYLCRELAKMPYKSIGNEFGKKDHTTVMHACNKIENEIKNNKDSFLIVDGVKNIILQPRDL